MRKLRISLLLVWVFIKGLFHLRLDLDKKVVYDNGYQILDSSQYDAYQLKKFLEWYNLEHDDAIDYGVYQIHFETNYKHLDDPQDDVLEVQGLIYESDGKTPKNPASVYDMTWEEYHSYKKRIVPIARERKITDTDIIQFLIHERA